MARDHRAGPPVALVPDRHAHGAAAGREDRAGAASFASGWEACLAELDEVLGDTPPEQPSWAERHEEYVERFGLDEGTCSIKMAAPWCVSSAS